MNWLEWLAAALGLANIALIVRRSVWNFPFGMAMVALYSWVFFEARLYAEAALQAFFFVAQIWGWYLWVKAGHGNDHVPVRWLRKSIRTAWMAATAAIAVNFGWVLHRFTDASLPYADAAIAGASIVAQILMAFRRIENWVLWIVIDIASVAVYLTKGLWPSAALYVVFLIMSVIGLREWIMAATLQNREKSA